MPGSYDVHDERPPRQDSGQPGDAPTGTGPCSVANPCRVVACREYSHYVCRSEDSTVCCRCGHRYCGMPRGRGGHGPTKASRTSRWTGRVRLWPDADKITMGRPLTLRLSRRTRPLTFWVRPSVRRVMTRSRLRILPRSDTAYSPSYPGIGSQCSPGRSRSSGWSGTASYRPLPAGDGTPGLRVASMGHVGPLAQGRPRSGPADTGAGVTNAILDHRGPPRTSASAFRRNGRPAMCRPRDVV
jgi:hypothetical protein